MDNQKKVLIVEDEKNIVDILRFNLQRSGYQTVEAYDGEDGLNKALTQDPDIVLLESIAEALGVSHVTVSRYLKEHGIQMERRRFIPSKEWREFMGLPAQEVVEDAPRSSAPVEVHEEPIPFLRGSLVLAGTKGRILQRLYEVLPDNVTVTVEFTTEADCQ